MLSTNYESLFINNLDKLAIDDIVLISITSLDKTLIFNRDYELLRDSVTNESGIIFSKIAEKLTFLI